MSHITTCTTCGKLYEEFSEESASDPNERECGACWMKRKEAEHEAREFAEAERQMVMGLRVLRRGKQTPVADESSFERLHWPHGVHEPE